MAESKIPKELVGAVTGISSFLNSWTDNGACLYQRIGDLGIINCSIRNGTVSSGIKILQMQTDMKPARDTVAPCINLNGSLNGYVLINMSGEVKLYVSSNASVAFTLMYKCA